jgi:hypothetical protein
MPIKNRDLLSLANRLQEARGPSRLLDMLVEAVLLENLNHQEWEDVEQLAANAADWFARSPDQVPIYTRSMPWTANVRQHLFPRWSYRSMPIPLPVQSGGGWVTTMGNPKKIEYVEARGRTQPCTELACMCLAKIVIRKESGLVDSPH